MRANTDDPENAEERQFLRVLRGLCVRIRPVVGRSLFVHDVAAVPVVRRRLFHRLGHHAINVNQRWVANHAGCLALDIEFQFAALREELEVSQVELASALGVSQPAVVAMEQRGNDIKLSTMKRYVEAMGGKLRVDVELLTGRHIGCNV